MPANTELRLISCPSVTRSETTLPQASRSQIAGFCAETRTLANEFTVLINFLFAITPAGSAHMMFQFSPSWKAAIKSDQ